MGDQVFFNTSKLDGYARLLESAPDRLAHLAVQTVKRTMVETKKRQQDDFAGSRYSGFRAIARYVEFTDPEVSGQFIHSRLGIRKGEAGSLGNIAVYGTWKGGGTHMHPIYHLRLEMPTARRELAKAMKRAVTR